MSSSSKPSSLRWNIVGPENFASNGRRLKPASKHSSSSSTSSSPHQRPWPREKDGLFSKISFRKPKAVAQDSPPSASFPGEKSEMNPSKIVSAHVPVSTTSSHPLMQELTRLFPQSRAPPFHILYLLGRKNPMIADLPPDAQVSLLLHMARSGELIEAFTEATWEASPLSDTLLTSLRGLQVLMPQAFFRAALVFARSPFLFLDDKFQLLFANRYFREVRNVNVESYAEESDMLYCLDFLTHASHTRCTFGEAKRALASGKKDFEGWILVGPGRRIEDVFVHSIVQRIHSGLKEFSIHSAQAEILSADLEDSRLQVEHCPLIPTGDRANEIFLCEFFGRHLEALVFWVNPSSLTLVRASDRAREWLAQSTYQTTQQHSITQSKLPLSLIAFSFLFDLIEFEDIRTAETVRDAMRTLLKQERKNVFLPSVRIRPLRFFDDNDRESNNDSTHRLPFVEMTMSLSSVYDDSVSECDRFEGYLMESTSLASGFHFPSPVAARALLPPMLIEITFLSKLDNDEYQSATHDRTQSISILPIPPTTEDSLLRSDFDNSPCLTSSSYPSEESYMSPCLSILHSSDSNSSPCQWTSSHEIDNLDHSTAYSTDSYGVCSPSNRQSPLFSGSLCPMNTSIGSSDEIDPESSLFDLLSNPSYDGCSLYFS